MNSISPDCQELKVQYDECFNRWFKEKFLKGLADDTSCADLFSSYQSCVKKAMKEKNIDIAQVEKDVLGTASENQPPHSKSTAS